MVFIFHIYDFKTIRLWSSIVGCLLTQYLTQINVFQYLCAEPRVNF